MILAVLTRAAAPLLMLVLLAPVAAGLAGTLLPAFGHLPAIGLDGFSLDPWRRLLAEPGLGRAMLLSLATGLVSALLSLAAAAVIVAAFDGTPLFRNLRRLLSPLLALPHAAAAFGLAALIAPAGVLARLLSPWATGWTRPPDVLIIGDPYGLSLILGLVAKETPFLLLMLIAALPQADAERRLMAARTLGYRRFRAFFLAVWPSAYPQIRLAVFAVIIYGASNVDMALVLGPTTPPTLAVMTLRITADADLTRRTVAAAAALTQAIVAAAALLLWVAGERAGARLLGLAARSGRRGAMPRAAEIGLGLAAAAPPIFVVFAGIGSLALWSVTGPWPFGAALPLNLGPENWARTMPTLIEPMLWSLALGLGATLPLLALVTLRLERETQTGRRPGRLESAILYTPLIVPQLSFLFGLTVLTISASFTPVVLMTLGAHMIFVAPYLVLSLAGPWRALDPRYALVARTLGASPAKVFLTLRLRLLLRPILTTGALGLAVSIAQYLPTLLVSGGRIQTVTTEALALSAGNDRRVIGVVALVQTLLPLAGFAFAAALSRLATPFQGREARG